jgi:hypothetical protein
LPEPIKLKIADLIAGKHKVAISLPDLVNSTNQFSVKNRPGCSAKLQSSNPKDLFLDYNVKCTLPDSDPKGHEVKIHFDTSQVKDATSAKKLDVAVSCSCPAFLYWGQQWNTYMRDALEGEPRPLLTRPTERLDLRDGALICKHIKVVSERIMPSVQHNIDKLVRAQDIKKRQEEGAIRETPEKLEEKQRNLKDKGQGKPPAPESELAPANEDLRQKFKNQIQNQHTDVVKRDEPATPEEKEHLPKIHPDEVESPEVATPQTGAPVPEVVEAQPQKMPQFTHEDHEAMDHLSHEPNAMGEDEEEAEDDKWERSKRNR